MQILKQLYKTIYLYTFLTKRFFITWLVIIAVFTISFNYSFLFTIGKILLISLTVISVLDFIFVLIYRRKIECIRTVPNILSLGDEQNITLRIKNKNLSPIKIEVIDELPIEFQKRDFSFKLNMSGNETKNILYNIRPLTRGAYTFGNCNIFVSTLLGLIQHKQIFALQISVPVYPSIIQLKKHELQLFNKLHSFQGIKKSRKIGHSYEFEQIKNYASGDDYRTINWKATSKKNQLMVNQFGDEKSQQVYNIIDKSRAMIMPFNGLSLLDYAINSTLVISNTVLHKDDKAGLLTFNEKMGNFVKADRKIGQLKRITEVLYKEEESSYEANYELLYDAVTKLIKQRSLLIFYTNFESYYTLERYLPVFRKINKTHLLLLVVFKNTEIEKYSYETATDTLSIYQKTIGKKMLAEKEMLLKELAKYGIQALLTAPQDLSTQTINKYLEFKAKGWI